MFIFQNAERMLVFNDCSKNHQISFACSLAATSLLAAKSSFWLNERWSEVLSQLALHGHGGGK